MVSWGDFSYVDVTLTFDLRGNMSEQLPKAHKKES